MDEKAEMDSQAHQVRRVDLVILAESYLETQVRKGIKVEMVCLEYMDVLEGRERLE